MIDRLRSWWERPIAEHERRRAFALAAAVILLAGTALVLTRGPATQQPERTHARPAATAPVIRPATPTPTPLPAAPVTGRGPAAAGVAARRFLGGYLAYLYGHATARTIRGADPGLVRRLVRERVRVSPATRQRRPQIYSLQTRAITSGRVVASAVIADGGVARYTITIVLTHAGERWQATAVSGD